VVRSHPIFRVSYRDLELILADRGMDIAHARLRRDLDLRSRDREVDWLHLWPSNRSCRFDQACVRLEKCLIDRYRAAGSSGQPIGFLRSARRGAEAPKRFFREALGPLHTVNPRAMAVDKKPTCPCAIERKIEDGKLWRLIRLRRYKFRNKHSEKDRRRSLVRSRLSSISFSAGR
jgi:transposase-like protein